MADPQASDAGDPAQALARPPRGDGVGECPQLVGSLDGVVRRGLQAQRLEWDQRMVVIDDRIAFCGGIDATMCR